MVTLSIGKYFTRLDEEVRLYKSVYKIWHVYQFVLKLVKICQQNGKHAVFDTTDWLHNTLAYCTWATFNRNRNIIPPTATDLSSSSILNEKYVNHGGWSTHMHSNFSMLFRWKVHMTIQYYGIFIFIFPSPSLSLTSLRLVLWYCMANLNSNPSSTIPHIPTNPISYSFWLSNEVGDKVVPIHFPNLAEEGLPNCSRSRLRKCNG